MKKHTNYRFGVAAGGIRFKTGYRDTGEIPRNTKSLVDAACDAALTRRGVPKPKRWGSHDLDPIGP